MKYLSILKMNNINIVKNFKLKLIFFKIYKNILNKNTIFFKNIIKNNLLIIFIIFININISIIL